MRCYLVEGIGFEHLKLVERPIPTFQDNEVLIDVKAWSLNYRDLLVVRGQYGAGKYAPFIPFSDMAGVVREVGSKVSEWKIGDRVMNSYFRAWVGGTLTASAAKSYIGGAGQDGVLAEQIAFPKDALVAIPSHMSFAEAATLPVAGLTAWSALFPFANVQPGDWVLLEGSGGVSIFAAQLAKAVSANVILTTSSQEKAQLIKKQLGVETVLHHEKDWPKKVKEITQGQGVDIVVDVVGGETLAQSLHICNFGAKVAVIGVLAQNDATLSIFDFLQHQITLKGIYVGSTEDLRAFAKTASAIQLKPVIDREFSFIEVPQALQYLESQKHIGKIVVAL